MKKSNGKGKEERVALAESERDGEDQRFKKREIVSSLEKQTQLCRAWGRDRRLTAPVGPAVPFPPAVLRVHMLTRGGR